MTIAEKYVAGLKEAYLSFGAHETWQHFENIKHGATKEDLAKIKEVYPLVPDSLLGLLEYVDGTHWREYQGESIVFFFLGSDVEEYPYYLSSSETMVKDQPNYLSHMLTDQIQWLKESGGQWDEKLTTDPDTANWLHFSDCMNNGGTSMLFIDFTPSPKGKVGQVVRYLHDPDEINVIADSFDEYLQKIMDSGYDFINEDTMLD